jgi:hypothetical protein
MLRFHPRRFIWVLALMLGIWMAGSQAQEYRYHYVSLNKLVPKGYACFLSTGEITNSGQVYGTTYSPRPDYCDDPTADNKPYVAVYKNGTITVLQVGKAYTGNEGGTIGGSVYDEDKKVWRAALFHGNKVELIPRLSKNELESYVAKLTDSGIALVVSVNRYSWPPAVGDWTYALYKNGQLTWPDFGSNPVVPWNLRINNRGLIAGTQFIEGPPGGPPRVDRAFLLNPRSGESTQLNPLPLDVLSWGVDTNNRGDVLGYSFDAFGVPARIGVWSNQGQFETYFDESTVGFVSNTLGFNDNNLIVVSSIGGSNNNIVVALVPEPGVLLNLKDLVVDLPPKLGVDAIPGVNNHGDMIGYGCNPCDWTNYTYDTFLLLRVGPKSH